MADKTAQNRGIRGLVSRLAEPFVQGVVDERVKEKVAEELSKVRASDIVRLKPRQSTALQGGISKTYPLGVNYQTLRDFSEYYPIARACIDYRKSQITQLDWNFSPIEVTNETVTNDKNIKASKELKKLFKYPISEKDRSVTFTNWMKQILEDLLVIDAVAIYRNRNRGGDVIGYLPVDAATINLVLQRDGTTPEPPKTAYIQKVSGEDPVKLTTNQLIYRVMNPRTHNPFGLAPLETLIITVTTALKLQSFNLAYLTEGNVPEGFVELPPEIASSRDQLKEWQDAWDAMLSGDPRYQRKLKFLPGGMKYTPTISVEDMSFERFELWLLQNTCAVFGVQPTAIGFNFEANRSVKQTDFEVGKERGLFPTALFVKELLDGMIQEDLGYEEMNFVFTNLNPTNRLEEARIVDTLITNGLMAIDEWRLGEGLAPTGVKDPFIMTPIGPIFAKDLAAQSESGQMPILPYKPPTEAAATSQDAGNAAAVPNVPRQAQTKAADMDNEVIDEVRRWKKAAINDLKRGKMPRDFKTDIISVRNQHLIRKGLKLANTREKIEAVFDPFIKRKDKLMESAMKMYDDVNKIISARRAGKAYSIPVAAS